MTHIKNHIEVGINPVELTTSKSEIEVGQFNFSEEPDENALSYFRGNPDEVIENLRTLFYIYNHSRSFSQPLHSLPFP